MGCPRPLTGHPSQQTLLAGAIPSAGLSSFLAVEPLFSDDVALFTQSEEGARPKRLARHHGCTRQFSQGCIGTPLNTFNEVLRGGRLFEVGCGKVLAIDPSTNFDRESWPITGGADFFEPAVLALEVDARNLTLVLGSHDDLEVGRVVTFDDRRVPVIRRAPALDPDLVALMEGVLIVQAGARPKTSGGTVAGDNIREKALRGYAVPEAGADAVGSGRSDRDRLRDLIRGHGDIHKTYCSQWETRFDAQAVAMVKALPRWEENLASLLQDRDMDVQSAAFAAAANIRSPGLVRALLRLAETLPPVGGGRSGQEQWNWWYDVHERHQWTRVQAALVLIEMRHVPALKLLAAMALEMPLPDIDHTSNCSSFAVAFCSWIDDSDLPEAKAVIADHDRAMDAPGAWKALCSSNRH